MDWCDCAGLTVTDDDAVRLSIFDGYQLVDAYDEMFSAPDEVRLHCRVLHHRLSELQQGELQQRQSAIDRAFFNQGITFSGYDDEAGTEKIFLTVRSFDQQHVRVFAAQ